MDMLIQLHYDDAMQQFNEKNIVFLGLCGSQNYGLALPTSDVDTKLLVTPTFEQVAHAKEPDSSTLIRENNEHIDVTDIRLYINNLRKANPNFLETLFTDYSYINPLYEEEFSKLIAAREEIVADNRIGLLKAIKGMIISNYKEMYNTGSEQRAKMIENYGYNPKSFCQLARLVCFFESYFLRDYSFNAALVPSSAAREQLLDFKTGQHSLSIVQPYVETLYKNAVTSIDNYLENYKTSRSEEIFNLLLEVRYNIMKISITKELV